MKTCEIGKLNLDFDNKAQTVVISLVDDICQITLKSVPISYEDWVILSRDW